MPQKLGMAGRVRCIWHAGEEKHSFNCILQCSPHLERQRKGDRDGMTEYLRQVGMSEATGGGIANRFREKKKMYD